MCGDIPRQVDSHKGSKRRCCGHESLPHCTLKMDSFSSPVSFVCSAPTLLTGWWTGESACSDEEWHSAGGSHFGRRSFAQLFPLVHTAAL